MNFECLVRPTTLIMKCVTLDDFKNVPSASHRTFAGLTLVTAAVVAGKAFAAFGFRR